MRNAIIAVIGACVLAACTTSKPQPPEPRVVREAPPVELAPPARPRTSLADLAEASNAYTAGVFGSVEIRIDDGRLAQRRDANLIVQWDRILAWMTDQRAGFDDCVAEASRCDGEELLQWREMIFSARALRGRGRLDAVNGFFNRWPYLEDAEVYGASDHWATPLEFMRRSGDCEDFAIAKYMALRQLGTPSRDLRIVVLTDQIRRTIHAVLAVSVPGDILILDSLSSGIFSHHDYGHYIPHFSLNETGVWEHHGRTVMPIADALATGPLLACLTPPAAPLG